MNLLKIYIALFSLTLFVGCSTNSKKTIKADNPERMCDCFKLYDRQERGFYLKYLEGEDTSYTGKCLITRENGNEITYRYLKGHLLEIIERYPGGPLNEEMYYDTTGAIFKRASYHLTGHKSYEQIYGADHTYETFYDNGKIQRKGMYGLRKNVGQLRDKYFYDNTLYDSIWKKTGEFDSVYHFSEASITF